MTDRQFLWGLSGGVSVLTLAGAFWFGLGLTQVLTPKSDWRVWTVCTLFQFGACVGLLWAAIRLRRRSGFDPAELRRPDEQRRAEMRRMRVTMAWTVAAQAILVAAGVWYCVHMRATDRIWPWIGLIVSLHLIPLARAFHVRAYYVAGIAGAILSAAVLIAPGLPHAQAYLCGGMAAVMWLSATHVAYSADGITARAIGEPWA
jgi:hypothetical protein